jgi:predicted transcriptional regulator of viral defense system
LQLQCKKIMQTDKTPKVIDWVDDLQRKGRITFSLKEVYKQFPSRNEATLKNTLARLAGKSRIISVWKGFYVIIPIEYSSQGIVPPVLYINDLMKYLGRPYYISLLNAAVFYGAAHQQPQEFCVVTTSGSIRSSIKKGVKINFTNKKEIPTELVLTYKTKTGYVNVSTPELTAADLVQYEKETGGLNRVSAILNELANELHFKQLPELFFEYVPITVIQRLGYLLDIELGYTDITGELLEKMNELKRPERNAPLKNRKSTFGSIINKKWRIVVNEQIEIEE